MRASLTGILLALLMGQAAGSAAAGTAEALAALARGDSAAAVSELKQLAASGNADAQHHLARLHLDGRGVEKNAARAIELYRQAARGGDISAQLELAEMFSEGEGVARDPQRAYFWYMVLDQANSFAIRMYADAARLALADELPDVDQAQARRDAAAWLGQLGETKK